MLYSQRILNSVQEEIFRQKVWESLQLKSTESATVGISKRYGFSFLSRPPCVKVTAPLSFIVELLIIVDLGRPRPNDKKKIKTTRTKSAFTVNAFVLDSVKLIFTNNDRYTMYGFDHNQPNLWFIFSILNPLGNF